MPKLLKKSSKKSSASKTKRPSSTRTRITKAKSGRKTAVRRRVL
jgi:hypothetical protein